MTTEPGANAPTADPTPPPVETPPATGDVLAAEVAKWKALAKKNEDRAKANADAAKELDAFRQQSMTDVERAVDAARIETRLEAARLYGSRIVDAEVRAAAAGRPAEVVEALLEGLDRTRYMTEEGDANRDAIASFVNRVAPLISVEQAIPGFPDLGQGARGEPVALNGDPLLADLKKHLGIA